MPCIFTNLTEVREGKNMSIERLAEKSLNSVEILRQIEAGNTFADASTWRGIIFGLGRGLPTMVVENKKLIAELHQELRLYVPEEPCTIYYTMENNCIVFTDYGIGKDRAPKGVMPLKLTIEEVLGFFVLQGEIA